MRAFAVFWGSGKSLSQWQAMTEPTLPPGIWRSLVVEPDRAALYRRIDARMEVMAAGGGIEEGAALVAKGLEPELPIMKAVGLRELAAVSNGKTTLTAAKAEAAQANRRYAKRQLTWFRNQTSDWPRITTMDPADRLREAVAILTA